LAKSFPRRAPLWPGFSLPQQQLNGFAFHDNKLSFSDGGLAPFGARNVVTKDPASPARFRLSQKGKLAPKPRRYSQAPARFVAYCVSSVAKCETLSRSFP
jgi:hypothetical protein